METPWLNIAKKYLGECELPGNTTNNQFILDCFKHTSYQAGTDEVPWCAAFMCRVLDEAGMKSSGRADAKSYIPYGEECELKPGAVVVIRRKDGGFHVTMCHHIVDETHFGGIGGNQADSVKISVFAKDLILAVRWPIPAGAIEGEK